MTPCINNASQAKNLTIKIQKIHKNKQGNLAKSEMARLYATGGSIGLAVWLQFAVAYFGWKAEGSQAIPLIMQ